MPPDKNAAPLYLDALYDFEPELETYFPPDVRSERTPASKRRADRSHQLQIAWESGLQSKNDPAERDAVLIDREREQGHVTNSGLLSTAKHAAGTSYRGFKDRVRKETVAGTHPGVHHALKLSIIVQ